MDINQLTLDAIKKYYKVLENVGYLPDNQVHKLVLLSFIVDILNDNTIFPTEKEYSMLAGIIDCISRNTCLVPYNRIAIHTEPIKNYLEDTPVRISEDEIIRLAEQDIIRIANL